MSTLNISIPDSIRERVEAMAREDGVAVDSFVVAILAQRVAVADADSYVRRRASRGNARLMLDVLSKAPRVEPEPFDRLPTTTNG